MRLWTIVALLVTLSAAAAPAHGQGLRVLDEPGPEEVHAGRAVELVWVVAATDGQAHPVVAAVGFGDARGWVASVDPSFVNIPAGATQAFTVTVEASGRVQPRVAALELTLEDIATNQTIRLEQHVEAAGLGLVLARWENPLPDPLDGATGTFLLNILAWMAIGLIVMWLVNPTLKLLTLRTRTTLDDNIIRIVSGPVFVLVFAYGIRESLTALPLPALAFRAIEVAWTVVWVVLVVYAAFRLWHEVVLALGRRAASRTSSKLDDRLLPLLEKTGGVVIIIVGFFYLADGFGWNMAWLAAGGAIGGLVIAFAAQDTLANFFAGIHLLVDRPFVEGDDIILESGEVCTVKRIGLRSIDLYHPRNHEVIIVPNSLLAKTRVINLLRPDNLYKVTVQVGVAYGTDVQLVKRILLEIGKEHPLSLNDEGHQAFVRFANFGASSLDFSLTIWVRDVYARFAVASDLRELIEQRFAENGVEIPFPQHVIWQGRDEAERDEPVRPRRQLELHGSTSEARKALPSDVTGPGGARVDKA